jgi:hypothetical protein
VAAVELAVDGAADVEELTKLCRERLLTDEVPRVNVIVDELPRTRPPRSVVSTCSRRSWRAPRKKM